MIVPYKDKHSSKKVQVAEMFDNISPRYDFLNHFLSMGIDILWRKKAVRLIQKESPKSILDIATGTGDFAIEALKTNPERIVGVDISEGMLSVGREKMLKVKGGDKITLEEGDSENLRFADQEFDTVMAAFGVRNFEHLDIGLAEMSRVLKDGGLAVILEFSQPTRTPFKQLYRFYFQNILPLVGRMVSKDSSAYTYLPESVDHFPHGQAFCDIADSNGFKKTTCIPLTFGISSIYLARK